MPAQSRTVLLLSLALLLAGCGSGGGTAAPTTAAGAAGAGVLSVSDHSPIGRVLVDSSGKTVYFADQEATGVIKCMGPCLGFWFPVVTTTGAAPAVPGVPGLGMVKRSDNGQSQLTLDKKPLYTFKLDKAPGDSAGNNAGDDFGGVHFVWHAASIGGAATVAPSSSGGYSGPGGY